MLTHCRDCKFYSKRQCVVNPSYVKAYVALQNLSEENWKAIASITEPCCEYGDSPKLEKVSAEITLNPPCLEAAKELGG
ncbi:hypothetical protein NDI45_25230 [Leptolyngbya sp. GB1-A1]|uniref:hypothetical protein n=1 Tax=Leptolyngbya sp. GB1-A1 TaxID=2933908 RepID=UPI00329843B8